MGQKTQRLDQFISHATGLSRSQVKRLLARKEIQVNQESVTRPGFPIHPQRDTVVWQDKALQLIGPRYLLLHKPCGYECTRKSDHYPLIFDLLLDVPRLDQIQPVGRLDVDTSGLLLLTDDGEWAHRLMAPRYKQPKVYDVLLAEPLMDEAEVRLAQGLYLQGDSQPTHPATLVRYSAIEVRITLTEGRYHQVRRMFAALGNHVVRLHRVALGGVWLDPKDCPVGRWRDLAPEEYNQLVVGNELIDQTH